jgi:YHS domain-containing protein
MKKILLYLLFASFTYGVTETCPIMKDEENDPEETTEVLGKKFTFCCGTCVRKFEENTAYYIKAIPELQKRFTKEELTKLGVDDVKLLEQRYCPIYPERIVNPNSKTVEHNGKTIYLWSSSAARRWKRDADKYYQEAVEAGILK